MAVTVLSGALVGIEAIPIEVEVDFLKRLPRVCVVGLAAGAVQEAAERVRSAIAGVGIDFPKSRIVVNLAPADVRKDGTAYDLPMAIGILAAAGDLPVERIGDILAVGELALGGELRPVRGALSLAILARELGRTLILPEASAREAAAVPGAEVRSARSLREVLDHLNGTAELPRPLPNPPLALIRDVDLAEVRGQGVARRALEIAAAGAHHLLMVGPPGCGKSMLARRLPTILPPLGFDEAIATTRIHSAAGLLGEQGWLTHVRPFRAPHHTITIAGLIGDRRLRPGEVSLAHNGVLFLDEAGEFPRATLEVLRTPLEEACIRLVRAEGTVEYPAAITLVLASNPCPCGKRGGSHACACTDTDVIRYRRKLSGPILDRIDLHVELEPVPPAALMDAPLGEASASVRDRVVAARRRQHERGQDLPNGGLRPADVDALARPTEAARDLLRQGIDRHGLSGRSTNRVLRVARTIADLAGDDRVDFLHLAEALSYRPVEGIA